MDSQGIICNERTVQSIKDYARLTCSFLHSYSFLTDAYVLDYFVCDHWSKLPLSWQKVFLKTEPQELGKFLNKAETLRYDEVYPLSLLSFRSSAFSLTLPRKAVVSPEPVRYFLNETFGVQTKSAGNDHWTPPDEEFCNKSGQHKSLLAAFRRHVKPKKQHEIVRLAQVTDIVLQSFHLNHVLDIGSGQGHLSRLLCFHHGFKVATVEAEHSHLNGAANFDKQASVALQKKKNKVLNCTTIQHDTSNYPKHVEGFLSIKSSKDFLQQICKPAWPTDNEPDFGLLGLHTCGNLAATLLHLFSQVEHARAVLSVGCCYMKLDTESEAKGYPLSQYISDLPDNNLSTEVRQLACHALEMYTRRLCENAPSLKIHCYRAALEILIVKHYPSLKHTGLHGVKNAEKKSFYEYSIKALENKSIHIPDEELSSPEMDSYLQEWKKIIIFYSLRLLIAPVVESLLLVDRMLYLYENGCPSCIIPLFNPSISPRNHVLISIKKGKKG